MKASQIEKLLKGMYDKLLESIDNEEIKEIIKTKSFITGGCIPSMLSDEYINDFDIYFFDSVSALKVKYYYENKLFNKDDKFKVNLITDNSINLTDKIQIIIKWYGNPIKITNNFDWQHIKSYFIYPDRLELTHDVYRLIVEKELIYTSSKYPLSSLFRLKKYIKKGWHVSNTTILHITLDIIQAFYNPQKQYNLDDLDCNNPDGFYLEEDYQHKFSVEEVLYHLNGVDPLTIQAELQKKCDEYLTIKEIIKLF